MIKTQELTDPNSCMGKALDHEMTFVLLGRDASAPLAIRAWMDARIQSGKNAWGDDLMIESEQCAQTMESQRDSIRAEKDQPRPEAPDIVDRLLTLCETACGLLYGVDLSRQQKMWQAAAVLCRAEWEAVISEHPNDYCKPITPSIEFLQRVGLLPVPFNDGFEFVSFSQEPKT